MRHSMLGNRALNVSSMTSPLKRIRLEWYYVRRMMRQRRSVREWYRYIKNKYFPLHLLRGMPVVRCTGRDEFEVHILAPASGVWMTYWTIRSFLYHSKLCPRVIVHDDGTMTDAHASLLESKLSNVSVLRRVDADRRFYADSTIPEIVKRYRRECTNILLLMFVDHFFLSSSRYVLVLDDDLLFYGPPTEIVDFMRGGLGVSAIYAVYGEGRNPLDVDIAYQDRYPSILDDASRLNSGLMAFDKSAISIDRIVEYFEHVTKPNGHLIEQTGWGMVLSQVPHTFFSESRYKLRGSTDFPAVCKHFTTPRRHELFAYGIDEARERIR